MPGSTLILTGEQIRAGRALARLEQVGLAQAAGLSLETIKRLERIRGPVVDANIRTLNALSNAFAALGIVFESGDESLVIRMTVNDRHPVRAPRESEPRGATSVQHRVIYQSTVAPQYEAALIERLADEIAVWGRRNAALNLTGALIASEGRVLQALEGPRDAIRQVYGAVSIDPRHMALRLLQSAPAGARLFSEPLAGGHFARSHELFSHDPATEGGLRPEALSPAAALGLLSLAATLLPAAAAR
jgi:transcriptional regulator with XRE-family HTH domain